MSQNSPIQLPNSTNNSFENLPNKSIIVKSFDFLFIIMCTFCALMIFVAWISNFLMIAFTVKEATFQSYFWGCLVGIILYFAWIIIYSLQKDYLIFAGNCVQSFQTDFFLQTKKIKIPITNLQGFESLKIRRRNRGGLAYYTYKIQILTKDNQSFYLSNSDFSHKKIQKLLQEIKTLRDSQNLEFNVFENDRAESYIDVKSTLEIVVLILIYVLLPILVYFLFRF